MEWDQEQAGEWRAGLQHTELLKGPSQNLAGPGSQEVLAALLTMAGWESESFQELVDGEKGLCIWEKLAPLRSMRKNGGGSRGLSPTFCLRQPLRFGQGPSALFLQPSRAATSILEGPSKGRRQDPDPSK